MLRTAIRPTTMPRRAKGQWTEDPVTWVMISHTTIVIDDDECDPGGPGERCGDFPCKCLSL